MNACLGVENAKAGFGQVLRFFDGSENNSDYHLFSRSRLMDRPRKRPSLDHWYALRLRVRCELVRHEALDPLIARLRSETAAMIHCGNFCVWHGYQSLFQLFMDSAMDLALSRHWRRRCLGFAQQTLDHLYQICLKAGRAPRVARLKEQLTHARHSSAYPFASGVLRGLRP